MNQSLIILKWNDSYVSGLEISTVIIKEGSLA